TTKKTVTTESNLEDYAGCYLAFVDNNIDNEVSPDDIIWIYKDYNADGIEEVESRYTFKILDKEGEMVIKKQL
ncbi:hypothetical protein, partial [[Eubacterium] cellulosolvens]